MNFINTTKSLIQNWWALLIVGLSLVFLGIMVIRNPLGSYLTLSIFFALALFAAGISQTYFSLTNQDQLKSWAWYLIGGIFEIALGAVLLIHPGMSMLLLPVVVGIWLMFKGFSLIGIAYDMRSLGFKNWGWMLAGGILTALFSFLIIVDPNIGPITIIGWTALSAFIAGGVTIFISLQLRKLNEEIEEFSNELNAI